MSEYLLLNIANWRNNMLPLRIDHVHGDLFILSDDVDSVFFYALYGEDIEEIRQFVLDTFRLYRKSGGDLSRMTIARAFAWRRDATDNAHRHAIGGRYTWLYRTEEPWAAFDRLELNQDRRFRRTRLFELKTKYGR